MPFSKKSSSAPVGADSSDGSRKVGRGEVWTSSASASVKYGEPRKYVWTDRERSQVLAEDAKSLSDPLYPRLGRRLCKTQVCLGSSQIEGILLPGLVLKKHGELDHPLSLALD